MILVKAALWSLGAILVLGCVTGPGAPLLAVVALGFAIVAWKD
jgi:hypothetical protein